VVGGTGGGLEAIVQAVHESGGASSLSSGTWAGSCIRTSSAGHSRSPHRDHGSRAGSHLRGSQAYVESRALELQEIEQISATTGVPLENALAAGFDGVQLHAANAISSTNFLRDGTNLRTDRYGGDVENRIRLLVQVTQTLIGVAGADDRGAVSPNDDPQGSAPATPMSVCVTAPAVVCGFPRRRRSGRCASLVPSRRNWSMR